VRRSSILWLHRWVALIFVPFLLLQAVTGAILVIHDATVVPDPHGLRPAISVTTFTSAAARALPGYHVTRLFMPGAQGATVSAELTDDGGHRRYATLDPATGTAQRAGSLWAFPATAAFQLHLELASGRTGTLVVLGNALVLITLACSGFLFWWPGRKKALRSLAIRSKLPGRLQLRHWHRTIGVVLSAFILFSAITGMLLVAPNLLAPPVGPRTPFSPPTSAQVERAVAAAQAQFPRADLRDIRFPPADRLDVEFFAPERNPRAVHVVSVRPSDGAILKVAPAADNRVLWMKILPLHTGNTFGLLGIAILLAEAGGLLFLACAGPVMWVQSRPKRKVG